MDPSAATVRLYVIGDELAAGVGDPRTLGWVGRVIAQSPRAAEITPYVLAVPGETTGDLATRWTNEVDRRRPVADAGAGVGERLAVALSGHDLGAGLSTARSRLNVANVLDSAMARGFSPFVVGPAPLDPTDTQAVSRLASLDDAFADVASRRSLRYASLVGPLIRHDQWIGDLAAAPRGLPSQVGYGLITWLVLHAGWEEWIDKR